MMLYQQEQSDLKFILNYIPLFTLLSLEMGCHIAQFVLAPNAEWGKTFFPSTKHSTRNVLCSFM